MEPGKLEHVLQLLLAWGHGDGSGWLGFSWCCWGSSQRGAAVRIPNRILQAIPSQIHYFTQRNWVKNPTNHPVH